MHLNCLPPHCAKKFLTVKLMAEKKRKILKPEVIDLTKDKNKKELLKQLRLKADPNFKTKHLYTPLHYAAEVGAPDCARVLIHYGADVNAANRCGSTPLHNVCASACGDATLCEILIHAGAKADVQNRAKWTPLHAAAFTGKGEMARLLLERAKASPSVKNGEGKLPHQLARAEGHGALADYLHGEVRAREPAAWQLEDAAKRKKAASPKAKK